MDVPGLAGTNRPKSRKYITAGNNYGALKNMKKFQYSIYGSYRIHQYNLSFAMLSEGTAFCYTSRNDAFQGPYK